ncbi:MAG: FdtA/QdtA family cupin domain-containing protein [Patescibacteria group bacterium]|jgi:dTDP-4-dehydrorhamnose 3,5-epimerase-like enzyme
MIKKTRIKNTSIAKFQFFNDFPDGNLVIIEEGKNIPFPIKRVYFINNLFNPKALRGMHAHKKLEQVLFCVNGSFVLTLDDGTHSQKITVNDPYYGIKIGPKVWRVMNKFSKDCVILVLASQLFKKSDYIRNYEEFIKYVKK